MINGKRSFSLQLFILIISLFLISVTGVPGTGMIVSFAAADTISGGNVYGTWNQAGSPYYVTGDITIPTDSTLYIEPGVQVNFLVQLKFTVLGCLEAIGTEADSIEFRESSSFGGIFFDSAQDTSHLVYCSISLPDINVITFKNYSDPVISHCRITSLPTGYGLWVESFSSPIISDCIFEYGLTAIHWNSGTPGTISGCTISNCIYTSVDAINGPLTLIDCTLSDNTTEFYGAGIRSSYGEDLTLINCTVCNNYSTGVGSGVYCSYGLLTMTDCTLYGNQNWNDHFPYLGGSGVCLSNASADISYCVFHDNFSEGGGGGLSINDTGNVTIDHCTIDGNEYGGGLHDGSGILILGNPTVDITNSIISNNIGGHAVANQGTLAVEYCDFYNNDSDVSGNVPSGFGILTGTNYNGDSCDVYSNIFLDPLFVGSPDFHLTVNSPCIDAGDPAFPLDPDDTITDMGRYFFTQTPIEESPIRESSCFLSCLPNPCMELSTIQFNLPTNTHMNLTLYDISGRVLTTLVDGQYEEGLHELIFSVSELNSGVYFYRLMSDEFNIITKMVVTK